MKRILIVVLFTVLAISCATAQAIVYRDAAVAEWDAPSEPVLLTGEDWNYDVYLCDRSIGDPAVVGLTQMDFIGRATSESLSIDMTTRPRLEYWLVVLAIFVDANGSETQGERGDSQHNADPIMGPEGWFYAPEPMDVGSPSGLRDSGN